MKKLPSLILCGYERGGTTLLSTILNSLNYYSGFEVGILCCESPYKFKDFKPYFNMMKKGWMLSESILEDSISSSFEHFYNTIISNSPFTKQPHKKNFFDKTPIYMSSLGQVLNRTNFINKAIVIFRDPRAVFFSWAKRQKKENETFDDYICKNIKVISNRYIKYFIGCIAHRKNLNVLFLSFEELCSKFDQQIINIKKFLNIEIDLNVKKINPIFKNNVEGDSINLEKIYEYKENLSKDTQNLILNETKLASIFFFPLEDKEKYSEYFQEKIFKIEKIFNIHGLPTNNFFYEIINNVYFEPETYLLRNPNVLNSKVNPNLHYKNFGIKEKRL